MIWALIICVLIICVLIFAIVKLNKTLQFEKRENKILSNHINSANSTFKEIEKLRQETKDEKKKLSVTDNSNLANILNKQLSN